MMTYSLTSEQVDQVVSNTTLVMLARPDLLPEWRTNLQDLLRQARNSALDEEAIFVSAVLALLNSPGDTLPTGTTYDYAWQSILMSLQTGVLRTSATPQREETVTLDRLLHSVADAIITVLFQAPEQKDVIANELREMRQAAEIANVSELLAWLDDALALLNGATSSDLGRQHRGKYAEYWAAIIRKLSGDD